MARDSIAGIVITMVTTAILLVMGVSLAMQSAQQSLAAVNHARALHPRVAAHSVPSTVNVAFPGASIIVNTNASDCSIEGITMATYNQSFLANLQTTDVVACQDSCVSNDECNSYGFNSMHTPPISDPWSTLNCMLYGSPMLLEDGSMAIRVQEGTGVFFSDKKPEDGAVGCYERVSNTSSTTAIPSPTVSSTATSTANTTATATAAIPTKTNLPSCNFQGLPASLILNYNLSSSPQPQILDCQASCVTAANCSSYAFTDVPATDSHFDNCQLFTVKWDVPIGGIDLVIKSLVSGMWWSDRLPGDGTQFCYGNGNGTAARK